MPLLVAMTSAQATGAAVGILTAAAIDAHERWYMPEAPMPIAFDTAQLNGGTLMVRLPPTPSVALRRR